MSAKREYIYDSASYL